MPLVYKVSYMLLRSVSFCLLLLPFMPGCSNQAERGTLMTINGQTMGTEYEIKFITNVARSEDFQVRIKEGVDSLLETINLRMSTYIDSSEISRFNSTTTTDWFAVSAETAEIIGLALSVSEKSSGAFDVTAGPLVNLWGFGPEASTSDIPNAESIKRAMSKVGFQKLSTRPTPPSIKKDIPEVYCDLAAIAKGWGVDRVAAFFDDMSISDYLIEIGGEIKARGKNNQNETWQIGIATPDSEAGIQKIVSLNDASMATSGDYRLYFERDGTRYSHILDPRTGRPITHQLASVTVIDKRCADADAMATAIIVLGPEDGYDFALRENLAAFLIVRANDLFVEKMTPAFEEYLTHRN